MTNIIKDINEQEFKEIIAEDNSKLLIMEFYASWCNPCKMLKPVLEELVVKNDDLEIYKVNVDKNSALADELDIHSVPTLLFYREGRIIKQLMGFQPLASLENIVKSL